MQCLTIPNQITPEQHIAINNKINHLREQQQTLSQQIQTIQNIIKTTKRNQQRIISSIQQKEPDTHSEKIEHFKKQNVIIKNIYQPNLSSAYQNYQHPKHYDIKPNQNMSATELQTNRIYKQASFNNNLILTQDNKLQYRVEVVYEEMQIVTTIFNLQSGSTNYLYGLQLIDNQNQSQSISQKVVYSIQNYTPKKFTIPLALVLLVFENEQKLKVAQIQQIKTISVPLPPSLFVEKRLMNACEDKVKLYNNIKKRLFIYEIEILYSVDVVCFKRLIELDWICHKLFCLRGHDTILLIDLPNVVQGDRLKFWIGGKDRLSKQLLDMIEYFCFMLSS